MSISKLSTRLLTLATLLLAAALPAAAQFSSKIEGEVRDLEGKPFPDVIVRLKNVDKGQTAEVKTDKHGRYQAPNLQSGIWELNFFVIRDGKEQKAYGPTRIRVATGAEERLDVNFKELMAKQSLEQKEEMKRQEEEKNKFETMRMHFDSGRAALDEVAAARKEMMTRPSAERASYQQKISEAAGRAVTEFEEAQKNVEEKDSNYHVVQFNLGRAYDEAARYEDAIGAYNRAIAAAPQNAGYYQELGTTQARAGKVADAMVTCDKAAAIPAAPGADPKTAAANCYGNVGIVLQNTGRMKESVEPLKKATEINPAYADYWFLLGRGLTNAMEFKKEGDKYVPVVIPGTAEAYQKYLELAPQGRFAKDAKDSLDSLAAMGAGISTKVSTKGKKKSP
jgi:tetratricopeptide (TPR) repeat protein